MTSFSPDYTEKGIMFLGKVQITLLTNTLIFKNQTINLNRCKEAMPTMNRIIGSLPCCYCEHFNEGQDECLRNKDKMTGYGEVPCTDFEKATTLSKRLDDYLLQCPFCAHKQAGWTGNDKGLAECRRCKRTFPLSQLRKISKSAIFFRCPNCGGFCSSLSERSSIGNMNAVICYNNDCSGTLVAISGIHISKFFNVTSKLFKDAAALSDGLFVLAVSNQARARAIVHALNYLAKSDDAGFRGIDITETNACLIMDKKAVLGYLSWNECENKATLRQVFIRREFRRKGYGRVFVDFWVKKYADLEGKSYFFVESPNSLTGNILVKLGHAYRDSEGNLCGKNARFFSCG